MVNPFFSVIIPCYNYERYVAQAIRSVNNQDFASFEVIAVNAGSTDNSRAVIEEFKNIVITDAPSGSAALACDVGLKRAQGDWIIFLDADDFLFPHALSTLAPLLHADYVKCQFNLSIVNKHGVLLQDKMIRTPSFYNSDKISKSFFLTSTYIWPTTSGNAYNRHFINRLFPLPNSFWVDGVLNTIAPSFGRILHINTPLGALS